MHQIKNSGREAELFAMRGALKEPMYRPGSRFHTFRIKRLLGRGGMAEVYEATHKGQPCAIKMLRRELQLDPTQIQRFENESTILLKVRHDNLVDVQDMGVHEGTYWMRMELLVGMDLREAIHRLGAMSVGLVGGWLRQVAFGAHQCHTFGVVHRDIKPENVMLLRPDGVKLLDLGVAKIDRQIVTLEGGPEEGLKGTALYMASEQVKDEKHITPAADVHALGMMGWEMLKGEHPWMLRGQHFDLISTLYKQVHEEAPPLHAFGFDRRISRVFERALSKDWRARQPDGLAFAEDLGDAVDRYLTEHRDEDPNPGEPVLAWLFGEKGDIPSFGTGPMSGRRMTGIGPRRSVPIPVGPLGSANELPPDARPIPRFPTEPLSHLPPGWFRPPVAQPITNPDDRVTDLSPPPLEIRRFDTISMPPELRDPSAVRALVGFRPVGKTQRAAKEPDPPREPLATPNATVIPIHREARGVAPSRPLPQQSTPALPEPPGFGAAPSAEALTERTPRSARSVSRGQIAAFAVASIFVLELIYAGRWSYLRHHAPVIVEPAVEPAVRHDGADAGSINTASLTDAGRDGVIAVDSGLVQRGPADATTDAAPAADAGHVTVARPQSLPIPAGTARPGVNPARPGAKNVPHDVF
jgi:serine/threonine protein kinase